MGNLGELERCLMERLWDADDSVSATQLRDELADRNPALTTVHTVLTRLERKGFVTRQTDVRPNRYSAVFSREEHMADLMSEVLNTAPDRQAVLARFLGTVSEADSQFLGRLLESARA